MLTETSKKIKAKQAIFGSKNRIKTFGVMSPENPNAETATKEQNEAYYAEFKKMLQKNTFIFIRFWVNIKILNILLCYLMFHWKT